MKKAIKAVMKQVLPDQLFTKISSVRSRNYQAKFFKSHGLFDITEQMIEKHGLEVLHGPFKGMIYPRESLMARHGTPKLLGSYEQELHPIISEVIAKARQYDKFVDIGCAEGYFAVGLAKTTRKRVDAFDTEPREIAFCSDMAKSNGVSEQVITGNWCDSIYLQSLNGTRCFVLSDCEGYEAVLFDAQTIPSLTRCDLLIELHDTPETDMSELICERFSNTHHAKIVSSEPRKPEQFGELNFLGENAAKAISEYRYENQKWVFLQAKAK